MNFYFFVQMQFLLIACKQMSFFFTEMLHFSYLYVLGSVSPDGLMREQSTKAAGC